MITDAPTHLPSPRSTFPGFLAAALSLSAFSLSAISGCGGGGGGGDDRTTFVVRVANVSTPGLLQTERAGGAIPLSPGSYAVYTGMNPAFSEGQTASDGTRLIAEDGFPMTSADELAAASNVSQSGIFVSPGGMLGDAFEPGASGTFTISAQPGDKLTFESMFVQSNDWFFTFDGLDLFDVNGTPISGDVSGQVELYDAGTEIDTMPGTGDFQKPVQAEDATDFGPNESVPVTLVSERHPGFAVPAPSQVIQIVITPQ